MVEGRPGLNMDSAVEKQKALDERFLHMALAEAQRGSEEGEVPIGCVLVKDGRILGRGYNRMESLHDPTAHAEIIAIGAACEALSNWRLDGCTLYVTLEPCPMCAGAILNSRIARVVFGAKDKRLGALGSTYDILRENPINREVRVDGPAMEEECIGMLQDFFREIRVKKKTAPAEIADDFARDIAEDSDLK